MTEVLRSTDPRLARLEAEGWRRVGESWGARLRLGEPPDLAPFRAVRRADADGWSIRELGAERADDLTELDRATAADYPVTPATRHEPLTAAAAAALWHSGHRVFAAVPAAPPDAPLAAVTVVHVDGALAETDFTAVRAEHRRRGLGAAVKSASILALAAAGHRRFGTGGAQVNAASIGVNESLGYVVEERWFALEPPEDEPEHDRRGERGIA